MDSLERFEENELPNKECFFSSVSLVGDNGIKLDGHINNEEYLTCKNIVQKVDKKNMDDYHDDILKKYVLLLADIFEKFIDTCMKFYGLNPVIILVLLD